jgi:uncharacterized RDD family membrane protein YckC
VDQSTTYPGQRLGLPEDGPGSTASWVVRFVALFIDWIGSMLVASAIAGRSMWSHGAPTWVALVVFVVEAGVLTALAGGSFGQLLLRVVVVRLDRRPLGLLQALLRSVLVLLVVPPLIFNRDNRGLHDLAVGSVVLSR